MHTTNRKINGAEFSQWLWLVLAAPPLLFLVAIALTSLYFAAVVGANIQTIGTAVTRSIPHILLAVEVATLVIFIGVLRAGTITLRDIGWRVPAHGKLWRECAIGASVGVVISVSYFSFLSPLLTSAQQRFGDYVPPGELLPTLGAALVPFFIANVVLAPLVEESIYRGYAITQLRLRFGVWRSVVISCGFFGLLHWAGGFWYILLTGVLVGGIFAGLFVWRRTVIAAYAAHLALNTVEFLYIGLRELH